MKSLDEKKLLAKMARNIGQPDLALEESIRREEELQTKLFKTEEVVVEEKPVLVEDKVFEPSPDLVHATAERIKLSPKEREKINEAPDPISAELTRLRSQLSEIMGKIGTMSWGGGGTGVVRFEALDDHQTPRDVRYLEFNPAGPGDFPPTGSIAWNPNEECMDVFQPDGTTLQVGLEQYIRVCNHTGSTLTQGTFVMFVGVEEPHNGDIEHTPKAAPYIANGEYPPLYTIGVMTEDLANGEIGRATTFGKVRNIDTTGTPVSETWQMGDLLWAHPTIPGALTNVQPTVPNLTVSVAAVLHVGASDGVLLVRPTIFPRLHTGKFYDTTNQTAAEINTPYAVKFNSTDLTCGHVTIDPANTANVVITHQGYYDFDFQLQATSTNSSRAAIWIWIRQNGVDVPNSATKLTLESNGGVIAPSWSFTRICAANDVFQLMWAVDSTNVSLTAPAATGFAPSTPSATLKVRQVNL